jgi:hypothetical protein
LIFRNDAQEIVWPESVWEIKEKRGREKNRDREK